MYRAKVDCSKQMPDEGNGDIRTARGYYIDYFL
jgi:hypothetical protein